MTDTAQQHTINEFDEANKPKSTLISKNITILGRRTSVRLEPEMWASLKAIAMRERCSMHDICSLISLRKHIDTSLTAAIRVFLMLYFKAAATEDGHRRAGHGNFEIMKQRARMRTTPTMITNTLRAQPEQVFARAG